jgi:hypothetical protein
MDYKGKDWVERHRKEEFQRSNEQLARHNQEMEKVTPKPSLKPSLRQWIKDALVAVAIGLTCGVGTTFLWHLF